MEQDRIKEERKNKLTKEFTGYGWHCKDCGGEVGYESEWLGETNGIGHFRMIYLCEDCGRWSDEIVEE